MISDIPIVHGHMVSFPTQFEGTDELSRASICVRGNILQLSYQAYPSFMMCFRYEAHTQKMNLISVAHQIPQVPTITL
jgi:hypothetical protein